jgi:YidC/Oxa1 family membrane protein insertase
VLKEYRETSDKNSSLKEMIPPGISGTVLTEFPSVSDLKNAVWTAMADYDTINISDKAEDIAFVWKSPDGIIFDKKFHFSPDSYLIGLTVSIKNGSQQPLKDNLTVSLNSISVAGNGYSFEGPSALINNSLQQVELKKIKKDKDTFPGKLKWIAIESRYFLTALITKEPAESTMKLAFKSENNILTNQYIHQASAILPDGVQKFEFELFFGPKSLKLLTQLNNSLDKAIYFGWFDFIAKPFLWLMNMLYHIIPNYGVAIIVLTILVKLILWPLGNRGYKSMNAMRKLQPLVEEIRVKYKADKQKMNQEVMKLYNTYKINPMGGCLPIFLQIPVFFALYRMLYEAIELRHARFFWWINDLSAPDRLFHFDFAIPFMQPPYGIPVLTLIMGVTMFIQQKMSPPPADPVQAKMFMFMPIIFTVIFINFSSGLVLYWLVNNILSIAQQYYISKKTT